MKGASRREVGGLRQELVRPALQKSSDASLVAFVACARHSTYQVRPLPAYLGSLARSVAAG